MEDFAVKDTCKRTQQLPALLGQQCWELLLVFCLFAGSLTFDRFQTLRKTSQQQVTKGGFPLSRNFSARVRVNLRALIK